MPKCLARRLLYWRFITLDQMISGTYGSLQYWSTPSMFSQSSGRPAALSVFASSFSSCNLVVVVSWLQCWQCKDCFELSYFGKSPRISGAKEGQLFCIWKSNGEGKVDSSQPKGQILWPARIAGSAGSWGSLLRRLFLPQHSDEGIETKHWQLC